MDARTVCRTVSPSCECCKDMPTYHLCLNNLGVHTVYRSVFPSRECCKDMPTYRLCSNNLGVHMVYRSVFPSCGCYKERPPYRLCWSTFYPYSHISLVCFPRGSAFGISRRGRDKADEQRVWNRNSTFEFGVELDADEPGMISELYNFSERRTR